MPQTLQGNTRAFQKLLLHTPINNYRIINLKSQGDEIGLY